MNHYNLFKQTEPPLYTDPLLITQPTLSDRGKYSLETLLNAQHLNDISALPLKPSLPFPIDRWANLQENFIEWPSLLSLSYPKLQTLDERIIRLPGTVSLEGIDPPLAAGSPRSGRARS